MTINNLNMTWKDNKILFIKQLELNISQLLSDNHPQHWKDLILLLKSNYNSINTFLDIGCGCGAYYKLLYNYFPQIKYYGFDFSEDAINIARSHWLYDNFYVKDLWALTKEDLSKFDVCHLGGILDVMTNADDALSFILGLESKALIISRINFTTNTSYYEEYLAYDTVPCPRYHHNLNNFNYLCEKYNYTIQSFNTNLFLRKK
jgi:predicted TPR repeat methyltransferase